MRLAYSTNAFTRRDLPGALRAIAELGFEGAEILCDRPHWFPGAVSDQEVEDIRVLLESLGLSVSNLNANTANGYYQPRPPENVFEPALTNPDPALRRWREDYTCEALRLAKRLGAPCISVTSGHPVPGHLPEQSLALLAQSLSRICELAESLNVRVGIEYEPGLLIERAVEARRIIDAVGSTHLGVNLDIGHSYLDGEAPEAAIALLRGRIWNVHVEDIKERKHYHLIPGEGDLPFARYFDALRDNGYDGFLTVELYSYPQAPVEAGARSRDFLRPLIA